jgi:glycosyltransferase involved in cell wall biosynthesis
MKLHFLCKRYYTCKDLIRDRFGRLYHLPYQLHRLGSDVSITAIDYHQSTTEVHELNGLVFRTLPATLAQMPRAVINLQRALHSNLPDILIASGDSHIGYLGLWLARRLGIPFVFDVYDYYPAFAGNRIPGMKTIFRKAVTGADLVLCASTPLMARLKPLNASCLLIENGVDRYLFQTYDRVTSRSSLGIDPDIPVIGYFGSMFDNKGPLLLDACQILVQSIPALRLLIAGPVFNLDIGYTWVTYLGELPQTEIPRVIAACDVCVVPLAHHPLYNFTGSCKIAEYLSCGKPVVATDVAGHREIFKAAPQSLCQPEPDDMAETILRQLQNPQVAPFPPTLEWTTITHILQSELSNLLSARSTE